MNKGQEELELSFDPYTFVRVNVMRSLLYKKADYDKLMKMEISEIAKYLQDTTYGDEITELGVKLSGTELVERSLDQNLEKRFSKLRMVSDANLRILVDAYLKRHDVWNIKTILRAKQAKQEDVLDMLSLASVLSADFYKNLIKEDSLQNIFKKLIEKGFISTENESSSDLTLIKIENLLDKAYYKYLAGLSERIPEQGNVFKDFLKAEINTLNLLMLLRLKREGMQKEQIREFLFFPQRLIKRETYNALLDTGDINNTLEKLGKIYPELHESIKDFKDTKSFIAIERDIKKLMLRRSRLLAHKNILSIDAILSYLFAKEIEVNNLRMIIKGKTLEIENDFIQKELVM